MGLGKAVRRPAAPSPADKGAALNQPQGHLTVELRQALTVLQLKALPGSIRELHHRVGEQHPNPERSWSWPLAGAYKAVFTAVMESQRRG